MVNNQIIWQKFKQNAIGKRTASSLFFGVFTVLLVVQGGASFNLAMLAAATTMLIEWNNITKTGEWPWRAFGPIYIIFPCTFLIMLRALPLGMQIVLWLFVCVWITDVAAYVVGIAFGGPKLCRKISPQKTWSGLIGAVVAVAIFNLIFGQYRPIPLVLSLLVPIVGQIGDIFESAIKRQFHKKDSGNCLPGHGGLLDRMDSMLVVATFIWLMI